jgi:hypothetical protein
MYGTTDLECVAVADGNILSRQVPQSVKTFEEYTSVFSHMLASIRSVASLTIVAFDDPLHVPLAKAGEQQRRDEASKVASWPHGDAYDTATLNTTEDIMTVVANREARLRCFDEMARQQLSVLTQSPAACTPGLQHLATSFTNKTLLFDGVDPRGSARCGERVAQLTGPADVELASKLTPCLPIGEADIKLSWLLNAYGQAQIGVLVTVDSDSLCIELLQQLKRCMREETTRMHILCMRERQPKRDAHDVEKTGSGYTFVNMQQLYMLFQEHMYALAPHLLSPDVHRLCIHAVLGWILCGCDFVRQRGMRADVVQAAVDQLAVGLRSDDAGVNLIFDFLGHPTGVTLEESIIQSSIVSVEVSGILARMPRMRRQSEEVLRCDEVVLRKGLWTLAYWWDGTNVQPYACQKFRNHVTYAPAKHPGPRH